MKALICVALVLFFTVNTINCIKLEDLQACVKKNCTQEIEKCESDSTCSQSLECLSQCDFKDEQCTHKCYDPVAKNEPFWAVSFCGMECMEKLERAEGDDILQCHMKNCNDAVKRCVDDKTCNEASMCFNDCDKKDNICNAACLVKYIDDQPLFDVIHCDATCLSSFINE